MLNISRNTLAFSAALAILAQGVLAGEFKTSGTACWTGTSNALATSASDFGGTWQLTGTYVDDIDEANSTYFSCMGDFAFVAGKQQPNDWWCLYHYADESTLLSRGEGQPDGTSKSVYVSGTGSREGVTGGAVGSGLVNIGKPPQGQFAACRKNVGTMVLKD